MLDANAPRSALQCRYRYPQAPPVRLSLRHHEYIELKPNDQIVLKIYQFIHEKDYLCICFVSFSDENTYHGTHAPE